MPTPLTLELIEALIEVESQGHDGAIGDRALTNHAYGPLQIRLPVCLDVNRRYGTAYTPEEMLNDRIKSIVVCYLYLSIYATQQHIGRPPTQQDCARIWNGGPNGYVKDSTLPYWEKVQAVLGS